MEDTKTRFRGIVQAGQSKCNSEVEISQVTTTIASVTPMRSSVTWRHKWVMALDFNSAKQHSTNLVAAYKLQSAERAQHLALSLYHDRRPPMSQPQGILKNLADGSQECMHFYLVFAIHAC
jgi:hypothetical protein